MSRIRSVFVVLVMSALMVAFAVAPALAQQSGLVNVNIENTDIVVQVPIAIAANICDVSILSAQQAAQAGDTLCTASADAVAQFNGRGNAQGGPPQK
jgi:hypothetical protein